MRRLSNSNDNDESHFTALLITPCKLDGAYSFGAFRVCMVSNSSEYFFHTEKYIAKTPRRPQLLFSMQFAKTASHLTPTRSADRRQSRSKCSALALAKRPDPLPKAQDTPTLCLDSPHPVPNLFTLPYLGMSLPVVVGHHHQPKTRRVLMRALQCSRNTEYKHK